MSEAPRRTARGERTRERILEAATEVFARRGLHGTRVSDIAEQAGIAYGLVYHHFRNKDEILAAIYHERWGDYLDYVTELRHAQLPFAERIAKLVHFLVETYRQEPHLMTVMINEISRSYEFIESHDIGSMLVVFDAIEDIVEQGRRARQIRDDIDPKLVAYAVLGIAEMVLTGYVMGTLRRNLREDYAADERQLVALLLRGLASG
ncbi:MAG: hypothetical protein NVSMB29_18340 [Candidatus Dormibacteria bacterium]